MSKRLRSPKTPGRLGNVTAGGAPGTDVDLTTLQLDIYVTRQGRWTPNYGDVEIPEGWEFLPSGDAFLTRTVKAGGRYWKSYRPRGRNRPHRRLIGIWAPAEVISEAERAAEATAARAQSAKTRARQEERYQEELREAVLAFLDFSAEHSDVAARIAAETAAHAAVVGSGRVGRTHLLSLEQRAELAARAHIRHRYTSYEDELDHVPLEAWDEDDLYVEIKGAAHVAVDYFLAQHRK
jgi:hypothetical protein